MGVWGGGLAFDLANIQALLADFDQRTVDVRKTVGEINKGPVEPLFI